MTAVDLDAPAEAAYLIAATDQPRARRTADVITVVTGLLLAGWGAFAHSRTEGFAQALQAFAAALPGWATGVLSVVFTGAAVFALGVVVALAWSRRWGALRDALVAGALAAVVGIVMIDRTGRLWPSGFPEFQGAGSPDSQFPILRVTVVCAVLVAAAPHLARPLRRVGWLLLVLSAVAGVVLRLGLPAGALAAIGVGFVAGGATLLVFGSPLGFPDTGMVAAALRRVGIEPARLEIQVTQAFGVRRLAGTTADGAQIEVKAYGRDARDSQVAARAWHSLLYRGSGRGLPLSRLASVEHEALATLLAERAGVRSPRVLAASSASEEIVLLVTTTTGTPLRDTHPALVGDGIVRGIWTDVVTLRRAGISHGGLTGETIRIIPTGHMLTDFQAASLVPRDADLALDVTHTLVALADVIGVERTVHSALDVLGADVLAQALGYLQPPALPARQRRVIDKPARLLADLRTAVAAACDVEVPEPVKLRRLGPRDIATIVVLALFLSAMVPLLTGIDYASLWAELVTADWWLVAGAVALGQLAFVPQAVSMMFAVGRSIPLRPMTILQPAVVFISFAVPGMAGRVTMEAAFLYKYGVSPAASVTKGSIDAFAGFLVQVALLALALATGSLVLGPISDATSSPDTSRSWILLLVLALVAITAIAIWKVPRLHRAVVPQIRTGWDALTEVLRSPTRAVGMLGSNLVVQLLWGLALWFALTALGTSLSLITCTAVVVGTSLLQGLVPIPGGIGVSEAVIAALLAPFGVAAETAMGAAVIWRVATFYLPAVQGFVAARWLERHGYL